MSPEAQRIAIAESVGWEPSGKTGIWYHVKLGFRTMQESAVHKKRIEMGLGDANSMMPDYLNDLNAMHEVEAMAKNWSADKYAEYVKHIEDMMPTVCLLPLHPDPKYQKNDLFADIFALVHATAAQRAEAYLRTIGKWKER